MREIAKPISTTCKSDIASCFFENRYNLFRLETGWLSQGVSEADRFVAENTGMEKPWVRTAGYGQVDNTEGAREIGVNIAFTSPMCTKVPVWRILTAKGGTMRRETKLLVVIGCFVCVLSAGALGAPSRKFDRDVVKIAGSMTEEESSLARYVFVFYYAKFGFDPLDEEGIDQASKKLSREQYTYIVEKAAEFCKSGTARAAFRMGAFGEKALKALIVTAEKAWAAGQKWVDEGADEYDSTH